ncbi:GTPase HflX [Kineococcus gypseus]|uniref:GTPase HflX n=1 Tax=Kineococcus gypseus TaxID=1637102 RepID=UPI003D7C4871
MNHRSSPVQPSATQPSPTGTGDDVRTSAQDAPRAVDRDADFDRALARILAGHDGADREPARHDSPRHDPVDLDGGSRAERSDAGRSDYDGDQLDLADRRALRRAAGLSTELADVTEVEYRQLRLERVVLAGVWSSAGSSREEAEVSLQELSALAATAGSDVLAGVLQRRSTPDPATYLGAGKAAALADLVAAEGADTVVCDGELSASQRRGLEDIVKVKVVDRTAVILDIFAQHAKSREGKAQVELAQLEYLLPRLRGWGESMSRQAGGRVAGGAGIGSRGPGETKIELDRRRIRSRMAKLRREIRGMGTARDAKRSLRVARAVPSVSIAGYTNAGKSSLLNRLTGAGVLVEDALFATLDPTVRRAQTPEGRPYTLADTVGFVRQLPHQLVEAFRSTLEEVGEADLVLHVVDGSHPDPEGQLAAVRSVLAEVGADKVTELVAINKADVADPEVLQRLLARERGAVVVSARTGEGIERLRERLAEELPVPDVQLEVCVPYDRGELVHRVHTTGQVLAEEHTGTGTRLLARVRPRLAAELEPYRLSAARA